MSTTMTTTSSVNTPAATTAKSGNTTDTPGLNASKDNGGSSGLSNSQEKIVIGVVVGVGGAIILGAVGVVFWRLRRRRRAQHDEDADLMSGTAVGSGTREMAPSPASGTPFRSTLDQYHNPGPVNPASNF